MFGIKFRKTAIMLPLALLSVALATPASANWFGNDPSTGMRRHVGSAPNPTPQDIREHRKAMNERSMSLLMKDRGSVEMKILLDGEGAVRAIAVGNASEVADTTTGKTFSAAALR